MSKISITVDTIGMTCVSLSMCHNNGIRIVIIPTRSPILTNFTLDFMINSITIMNELNSIKLNIKYFSILFFDLLVLLAIDSKRV